MKIYMTKQNQAEIKLGFTNWGQKFMINVVPKLFINIEYALLNSPIQFH